MAWLKINPSKVKKLPKFRNFRIKFNWPPHHAFGFLCAFWGEVVETEHNESGEISDWTAEYLAETVGIGNVDPNELWEALVQCDYIEQRDDGRAIVKDWLEIAGPYLEAKYHSSDPQRADNIWTLHGQIRRRSAKAQKTPEPPQGEDEIPEGNLKATFRRPKGDLKATYPPDIIKEPPREEEKRFPSGIARGAVLAIHNSETQAEEGERRDKKRSSEVNILSKQFYALLQEKFVGSPVDFNWGRAKKDFREMLENNLGVQEIAMRFPNYFASTNTFVVGQGFSVAEFRRQFNLLEFGPILDKKSANQDNSHGRRAFDDGEGNSPDYKYDDSIVHKY